MRSNRSWPRWRRCRAIRCWPRARKNSSRWGALSRDSAGTRSQVLAFHFHENDEPRTTARLALPRDGEIGRAHVWTPVTNAHLVCRLLLEKKKHLYINDELDY